MPHLMDKDSKSRNISLKGVLLTHAHADAILGLDDLRHWTLFSKIQSKVSVFVDRGSFSTVKNTFPYLVDVGMATGGGSVSVVDFHLFEPSLDCKDLVFDGCVRFQPIPGKFDLIKSEVDHGCM